MICENQKEVINHAIRLSWFLQECLTLGTLRGFRHFDTFMRGREELVLRVYPITQSPTCSTLLPPEIDSRSMLPLPELISPLDEDLGRLRSHKELLIEPNESDKENPLQLITTDEWKIKDIKLWQIVAEIISLTIHADNPFEINFDFLEQLPVQESRLLNHSLLKFLETVYIQSDDPFVDRVYQDITKLQSRQIESWFRL
ncbi:hypothetical protein G6F70_003343 [Rhizopus microsporus]|nr:hypothetical protein G6F71_005243 [Rhizopus microsporus]KAG1201223.1 hypothetical protein G6F70_003343 [Rhizopus microsporus]KAG1210708.1 hypothetical protein G6F69_005240 [Rhizopus microsporus]KAG1235432.1 hypothetical protein G6F67_002762 [Rhizopus microsporus]KAG1264614.1 hypothetical protein G6F68_004209 [Rhizopus microsporus]